MRLNNVLNYNAVERKEIKLKKTKILQRYRMTNNYKSKKQSSRTINDLYYIRYKKKFQ